MCMGTLIKMEGGGCGSTQVTLSGVVYAQPGLPALLSWASVADGEPA